VLQSDIMKKRINKSLIKSAIAKKGPSEAKRKQMKAKEL